MPVSAKDFLEFAKWIHKPDLYEKEIGYRCSISRAYYAAFHVAKQHLQMDEYAEHEEVIERLKDFDNGYESHHSHQNGPAGNSCSYTR